MSRIPKACLSTLMLLLLLLLWTVSFHQTQAQFSCTLNNKDEPSCLEAEDDGGSGYCVWCDVSGFGFCVTEPQAETMEQNLPGIQCDRHGGGGDDDATPTTDDDATPNNDDDNITPSDDSIPDDFWTCLEQKTAKSCLSADCTWCTSKQYGFGLCMTGPTAESAAESDFFTCTGNSTTAQDDMDDDEETSFSFLRGRASGSSNIRPDRLRSEEEDYVAASSAATAKLLVAVTDPSDPSCLEAFLQNPTEATCEDAVDSEGAPCEFCTYQGGQIQICLNEEQAQLGEQLIGLDCSTSSTMSLLSPPESSSSSSSPDQHDLVEAWDVITEAVDFQDDDFHSVEEDVFSSLADVLGISMDEDAVLNDEYYYKDETNDGDEVNDDENLRDPTDPSCLEAFLQDPSQAGCQAATDNDGTACEFCTINLGQEEDLCLTQEQAQIAQQFLSDMMECASTSSATAAKTTTTTKTTTRKENSPSDLSCQLSFLSNPTKDSCIQTLDQDGAPCEYCTLPGTPLELCLTADQAHTGDSIGVECTSSSRSSSGADDEAGSLVLNDEEEENEQEEKAAAEEELAANPLDTSCLMAYMNAPGTMTPEECHGATDNDGTPCEFCFFADVPQSPLCMTSLQAEMANHMLPDMLACGATAVAAAAATTNTNNKDPYDPTCAIAYLQDPSSFTSCTDATDREGNACEFCSLSEGNGAASIHLCLDPEQAEMAESVGAECCSSSEGCGVAAAGGDPISPEEDDTTRMPPPQEIDDANKKNGGPFPLDPNCLAAGMGSDDAEDVCNSTMDANGTPCIWCNAAGVYGLCLSSEAAAQADSYLQCDTSKIAAVAAAAAMA